ncbi:unnamed protein product [Protopolystoma xenopodis]|uniref:Uncharacterized protein n=1 Tax=Protopolystoma xenopodis TaxID=117903 RepID=A0A448WXX3_9PLAT|nr:unnamed protein product [Protopolystoma xenopodis]
MQITDRERINDSNERPSTPPNMVDAIASTPPRAKPNIDSSEEQDEEDEQLGHLPILNNSQCG